MFENKLINSILIIIAFWLGSYIITIFMKLLGKFASKTKTSLDDKMLKVIKLPIRYLAILLGFYFASQYYGLNYSWKGVSMEDVFLVLVILLVGFTFSRILKTFFTWYTDKEKTTRKINQTMFIFIRKMISIFVYSIALLIIFGQLGIKIGPLLAGLGIAGLAIALGLQETLANLFAALFLVMDKSINIGDWIQLEDGTKAYIEDISWRSVRIRTIGGNTVIVPNSIFVGQKISSYDYPESPFFTSINVGVAYDTDLEYVEKVAIRVTENVIKLEKIKVENNNPIVRFKELADSSINFRIILKVDDVRDESRVKHTLIKEIVKEFNKENIEIPFPQRVIHNLT